MIRLERQKFPFTIENILSKYPNSTGDRRSCGTSGAGLREGAVSPGGGHTEAAHRGCSCCCYCSHCGDIFQTEFIHEGKTDPPLHSPLLIKQPMTPVTSCSLAENQTSCLQPVSTGGPRQQLSQTQPAGWGTLTKRGRSRRPGRCRGGPGGTGPSSPRSSWMHWRSCSCRTSIQT